MEKVKYFFLGLVSIWALSGYAVEDDHWDTQFGTPGADGAVYDLNCRDGNVLMTGIFNNAGEANCAGIAKWDGTNYTGFGSGFAFGQNPFGFALATRGAEVYVGGYFITNISGVNVTNLGKWDGSTWSQVGGGINGIVYDLLFKGNDLYVSGVFINAGGILVSNIARWDGTNWHALGSGLSGATNGFVGAVGISMALAPNGDLIVGGNFLHAGGVPVNNVARWDGTNWHALGSGVYYGGSAQSVSAVAVAETNIYVAGLFKSASGVNATNIARWDGVQWNAMGGGPSGTNSALAIVGTNIYTAGNFTNINGVAARHVARWNGTSWQPLAPGTAGEILTPVSCLASDGTNLYAGGDFIQAGNAGAMCVAKWDGVQWSALTGPKSQGGWLSSSRVAVNGTDVYLSGGLLAIGGVKANRIAHWNGSSWNNMGGGISGGTPSANAILHHEGNVYIGGNFTNAGGIAARNIAYWDGANWHAMASGLNSNVNALCIHNGQIFAGGAFSRRGNGSGPVLPGIARWDGSDWVDVPIISSQRINNIVNALVSDGINLYMGGNYFIGWQEDFPPHDGDSMDNIGYWDGSRWRSMGLGLSNTVNTLTFMGGELYAGGIFTNSGPTAIRRIAKWNGSTWSQVSGGITNGTVSALAANGNTLYVGGTFTNINGLTNLSRIVRWNGSQWQSLGSGIKRISPTTSSVAGIAVSGDDVYLAGSFSHAGGRPSSAFARWNETISFVPPVIRLLNASLNALGQFQFEISGLSSGAFTIQATTNLVDWSDIHFDTVPNTNFTDVESPATPARIYRVKTP